MLTILGGLPSPFVRKVRCVLEEKGAPYQNEPLMPFPKTPELLGLNPRGEIPILRDGELVVPDSSVICAYVERRFPEPRVYPEDLSEFARALWYEEYSDTKLAQGVGAIFFQRFVKKLIFQQEPDEEAVRLAIEEGLPPILDYLEAEIGDADHLAGGSFTVADAAVASQLVNLRRSDVDLDATRWPNLSRYLATTLARPSFKALLAEEGLA